MLSFIRLSQLVQVLPNGLGKAFSALRVPRSRVESLFDAEYYLGRYPDVASAGVNPFEHFMQAGWQGQRSQQVFQNSLVSSQIP